MLRKKGGLWELATKLGIKDQLGMNFSWLIRGGGTSIISVVYDEELTIVTTINIEIKITITVIPVRGSPDAGVADVSLDEVTVPRDETCRAAIDGGGMFQALTRGDPGLVQAEAGQ